MKIPADLISNQLDITSNAFIPRANSGVSGPADFPPLIFTVGDFS